jgi:hypothetical protein
MLIGCKTWPLTFREERRLKVFKNMVLRILADPKRQEVRENLRRLHNEEFRGLHSSPNITRLMRKNGTRQACDKYRGEDRCVQDLVGKHERKRLLGKCKYRWEY